MLVVTGPSRTIIHSPNPDFTTSHFDRKVHVSLVLRIDRVLALVKAQDYRRQNAWNTMKNHGIPLIPIGQDCKRIKVTASPSHKPAQTSPPQSSPATGQTRACAGVRQRSPRGRSGLRTPCALQLRQRGAQRFLRGSGDGGAFVGAAAGAKRWRVEGGRFYSTICS